MFKELKLRDRLRLGASWRAFVTTKLFLSLPNPGLLFLLVGVQIWTMLLLIVLSKDPAKRFALEALKFLRGRGRRVEGERLLDLDR